MSKKLSIPDDIKNVIEGSLGSLGIELIESKRYDELVQKLWKKVGRAKEFFPKKEWYGGVSYPGALIWVGEDYAGMRDFKMATRYFEKVVREAPEREKAWEDLVMALICLGYQEKDIKPFERALEFKPNSNARRYISLALISFGLEKGKGEYLDKALSLF